MALDAVRQSERARYYAENDARFLTPDPSGLYYADPSDPQSLNLYGYAENNPLGNIDPSGMECVWDDGSYDASDDPQTGSASGCSGQGGTWVDPSLFESVEGNKPGSWSGQGSSQMQFDWLTPGATVTPPSQGTDLAYDAEVARDQQWLQRNDQFNLAPSDLLNFVVKGVAQDTAGFPDVCSGGAFVYAGVQGKVGSGHGFAGYLGNYDSKEGWSNNVLVEGSKGNASAGAAAGSKGAEGLVFIPFAEAGGGLVGVSKNGLSVGGYAGAPESVPVGAGGGAYFTISSMGGCAHR